MRFVVSREGLLWRDKIVRAAFALITNILNSQNRKYVNRTSSVISACAIALAVRARSLTRKRKNIPRPVAGGGLRHLRRWFFLPVEPSTCIYIKWRVVGIFKSNSLSNKRELVQKGKSAGVAWRCEKGESLSTTSEITSSFLLHDSLYPEVLATPSGPPFSFSLFLSLFAANSLLRRFCSLFLCPPFTSRFSKPWPNAGNEKMIRKYTLGSYAD